MPRRSSEPPDNAPFEYRPGVGGFPPFGGMYRRGDPAQIPPNRIHLGINIRLANGETASRPGLVYVEGVEESACITGIFEIDDRAVGVYITNLAYFYPNVAAGTSPFRITGFNEEKTPNIVSYWDSGNLGEKRKPTAYRDVVAASPQTRAFRSFQRFRNTTLCTAQHGSGTGGGIYELAFSEDDNGVSRMDAALLLPMDGGTDGWLTSMCIRRERLDDPQTGDEVEDDVLYIGTSTGKIFKYDGITKELVHTLSASGAVDLLTYAGTWIIAAGANGDGFAYQERPGTSFTNQAWGLTFECNGMCEWLGEVIFAGNDNTANKANVLRWSGTGAPTSFFTPSRTYNDCRSPVVAGGALHWVLMEPLDPGADHWFSRATDFSTITEQWYKIAAQQDYDFDVGFAIPYRGAILYLLWGGELSGHPSATGLSIDLLTSGSVPNNDIVAFFAGDLSDLKYFEGNGYEAIPI